MNDDDQHKGSNENNKIAVIILAGGNSERMLFPKPFLPFDDQSTFLEHIIDSYSLLPCDEMICVLNHELMLRFKSNLDKINTNVKFILNRHPEKGRLYSLQLGLAAIDHSEMIFIHNSDNPYANRSTLMKLLQNCPEDGYSSPKFESKGGHPILLSGSSIQKVKNSSTSLTLREILVTENKTEVAVQDEKILFNINTPFEYQHSFSSPIPV